jgi:hypothetical protein
MSTHTAPADESPTTTSGQPTAPCQPPGQPGRHGAKRHQIFDALRTALSAKVNVFLVGPAGSGKTTVARQVAQSLSLPFHFNGALHSEYKLTGFRDAQGKVHRTPFREAFEKGGVYLFDEIDASQPAALLVFNAALANGLFDFPDRIVHCHPNFRCVAAANTWGKGASLDYIGRNALDAATLDRFATLEMRYDNALERRLAFGACKGNTALAQAWLDTVQTARTACQDQEIRHIVSPRATLQGLSLLTGGITAEGAAIMVLRRGLDETTWGRIRHRLAKLLERVETARAAPTNVNPNHT